MTRKNFMKIFVVACLCFFTQPVYAENKSPYYFLTDDISRYEYDSLNVKELFGNMTGCAVILNPSKQRILAYNLPMAKQRFSPFSTFKIVSSMLGLKYGVVTDAKSKMRYNGTKYWLEAWNKDITFKEAFQFSAVWYFRQLTDALSPQDVETYLQQLRYGNADVSAWAGNGSNKHKELNGFWLNSSLRISPLEQVEVMYRLFHMGSPYPQKDRDLVQDFMRVGFSSVYGKTGSDGKGQSWFVGFVTKGLYKDYFAFYVQDAQDAKPYAKELALKYFQE